ncbi:hypothetical protein [Pandoraea sp. PE-S2R-1]|uniref:hypothetical protein n=1 Tax=Pandoraea sp. PE-S2R-1 TaxID=1986994 RepID=UPI000B3FD5F3|nr:hypothetical protein [Pandoraea sp. PE-S2R-1]
MYLDKDTSGKRNSAASLEAPSVEEADGGSLDPDSPSATVVVPLYQGKAVGDTVTMHWEGETGAGSTSDSIQVTGSNLPRVIRFYVSAQYIAANDGKTVAVSYTVVSVAGGTESSDALTLAVGDASPEPGLVAPPEIEGVVNGVLNLEDVPAGGAKASVAPYGGMARYDVVFISINDGEWEDAKSISSDAEVGQPVTFTIARDVLMRFSGQAVSIRTQIIPASGEPFESNDSTVRILEPVGELPVVDVPLAEGGSIDPDAVIGPSVAVVVKPYQGIAEGDVITLTWTNASGVPAAFVETVTVGGTPQQDYVFDVPRAHVDQNRDQSALLSYTVKRGGGAPVASDALTLFIGEAFEAAVSVDATGKGYLVAEKPPLVVPAFATYTREGKFGTGPYTYQTSDADVAQVNNAGVVVATGNGSATISATDSLGQTRSHSLTVVGIRQVFFVSASANFAGAKVACTTAGLDMVSLDDMKAFWRGYYPSTGPVAGYMGWLSYLFWTGTQIGAGTAYAYDLNGGSEQGNATGRNEADFLQVIGIAP